MSIKMIGLNTEVQVIDGNKVEPVAEFEFTADENSEIKAGTYGITTTAVQIIESKLTGKDGKPLTWYDHTDPEKDSVNKRLGIQYKQLKTLRKSDEWVAAVQSWVSEKPDQRQKQADKHLLKWSKSEGNERGPNSNLHADNSKCPVCHERKVWLDGYNESKAAWRARCKERALAETEKRRLAKLEADSNKLSAVEAELEAAKAKAAEVMANPKATKAELLEAMAIIAK